MEVPQTIRSHVRAVLLSKGQFVGVYLDRLCEEYQSLVNKPLDFQGFGYENIEAFVRSIPDAARMQYCVKEKRMKVFGVEPSKPFLLPKPVVDHLPVPIKRELDAPGSCSGGVWMAPPGTVQTGHQTGLVPDCRGVYSLCFPAENKPDLVGTLRDMFNLAGRVFEITESPRWIFVRYKDLDSVHRALKMFAHLGLMQANVNALDQSVFWGEGMEKKIKLNNASDQVFAKRIGQSYAKQLEKKKKKKKKVTPEGPSYRVFVGNLDPNKNYNFDMFKKLFKDYNVLWVTLKNNRKILEDPRLYAFVLIVSKEQAMKLADEFNGYMWMGRRLVVEVKEKMHEKVARLAMTDRLSSIADVDNFSATDSSLPDLECPEDSMSYEDLPGLEPFDPYEVLMPGLEPDMPGLEPDMPGLEPDMPGLEPDMPGLESDMPKLEPDMPGLEPIPGLPDFRVQPSPDRRMPLFIKHIPTILIANLRKDVNEEELEQHFVAYHPTSTRFVTTQTGRIKAYMELASLEDMKQAVTTMNQTMYRGFRLRVDVPFNKRDLREYVFGPALEKEQGAEGGAVTLSEILKLRGKCLLILQSPSPSLKLGQQLQVLVTTVIADNFFWGQIVERESMRQLQAILEKLNEPRERREKTNGPGRCMAFFQGDNKWYRAWVMPGNLTGNTIRVFYLDYGNTATIPWDHTARISDQWVWELEPMAIPFTLTESLDNLKSRELSHLLVEVSALGNLDEGNMVVARPTSLEPNFNESLSSLKKTVIM